MKTFGVLSPVERPADGRCQNPTCGRIGPNNTMRYSDELKGWHCYRRGDRKSGPTRSYTCHTFTFELVTPWKLKTKKAEAWPLR